jgi:hypothetical protein
MVTNDLEERATFAVLYSEDGSGRKLRKVANLLPNYTVSESTEPQSKFSSPRKPHISSNKLRFLQETFQHLRNRKILQYLEAEMLIYTGYMER